MTLVGLSTSLIAIPTNIATECSTPKSCNTCSECVSEPECCNPCSDCMPKCCNPCCDWGNETEFRVAYFYPSSQRFRDIYSGARIDYEIETTQRLLCNFYAWANVSWFPNSGHSLGEHHYTTIDLVPVSFGLKYLICLPCCTKLYIGAGPAYYFLNTHDHSSCACIERYRNERGWGGAFKSQLDWFFCGCNYLDLFVDYLYLPLNTNRDSADQVGGLKVGLGIGHHF